VNAVAAASPEWPYGSVVVRAVTPIGVGYGLSGSVYRVEADAQHGLISFVLKREGAEATERALGFHRLVGPSVEGAIPTLLGGAVDEEGGIGVLLLEDVAPAVQGDALVPCTDAEALAAVRTLAHVHAVRPEADAGPRWRPRVLSPDEWAARLDAAVTRFPWVAAHELGDVPMRARRAVAALDAGPEAWIHGDVHLDNVLFRPDGRAVLLDWSAPVVGPPAVDLARLLTEGVNAGARGELAGALVDAYADELAARGVTLDRDALGKELTAALVLLVQTAVAWAGREEAREPVERIRALQENLLRSALSWASSGT
jgi:phosphotransferase family enzyme